MSNGEDLREAVADLRVAIAELKVTIAGISIRGIEDRGMAAKVEDRLNSLERWQSRIKGQVALIYFLIGILTTVLTARIFHIL